MNRRQVLALLGSAAFGGCLSDTSGSGTTNRTTTKTASETTTGTPTDPVTETQTTTAEPPELGVADPENCPTFDEDVKRIVCSPSPNSPMGLRSSSDSEELPKAQLSFTLENTTQATFKTNFYGWKIWKQVDDEWVHIVPLFWPEPLHLMKPGDSNTWNVAIDNTTLDDSNDSASQTDTISVAGFGPGTYAFGIDGWFGGQTYQNGTGFVHRFELTGEAPELTPVGIQNVERDGDVVTVTGKDEPGGTNPTYVVTRVENPKGEPRKLILEEIFQQTPLRNALAHFEEGVERVRLEGSPGQLMGVPEDGYVAYDGTTYKTKTIEGTTTG